jgi:hypothetical protein
VDSGADNCTFPLSFALAIGLDPLKMKSTVITGVGGISETYYADVVLDFSGVFSLAVYAGFSEGLDGVGMGLLGQCGFFDNVNVCFNHKQNSFGLELLNTPGNSPQKP